ncbi:MAG: hypothetical protein J5523_03645 [Muribaculaceae bacterium]|nr:hypothetical protein [Muribaculaceae bacterium]
MKRWPVILLLLSLLAFSLEAKASADSANHLNFGFAIAVIIASVLVLTIIHYHRKSLKAKKTIRDLQHEMNNVDADDDLKDIIVDEIDTIQKLLLAYYEKEDMDATKAVEKLKKTGAIHSPHSTFWINIERYLNNKHDGIISHLREQCPRLNQEDIKLICLYCCGMKPTFIMLAMDYTSLQTVYNKKNALSKKMEPTTNMKEILETVGNKGKSSNYRSK